jgi:hypothetical protein
MTPGDLDLLHGYLDGTIAEASFGRLQTHLRESAEARGMLRGLSTVDTKLQELAAANPATMQLLAAPSVRTARSGWLSWHPLTAAAAGLVIGLFSVWGYVGSYAGRAMTLLQESFESGPPPLVTGMPVEAGHWSGDYSEVVGEYRGVKPARGDKMLRFLRADYEGKPGRDGYVADLFRIVDLRDASFDVARGDACVSVEARFRALPQDELGRVRCGVTVYALDALPEPGERHDFFLKRRDGLLVAGEGIPNSGPTILATAARHEALASTGSSWQVARSELRVPPGTRYFMIHLHESLADPRGQQAPQPVEFAGLFVDDVRVTLTHRRALP